MRLFSTSVSFHFRNRGPVFSFSRWLRTFLFRRRPVPWFDRGTRTSRGTYRRLLLSDGRCVKFKPRHGTSSALVRPKITLHLPIGVIDRESCVDTSILGREEGMSLDQRFVNCTGTKKTGGKFKRGDIILPSGSYPES